MSKDLVFHAIIGKTLEEYSWAEIAEISESGLASKYFNIGDTKTITLNLEQETWQEITVAVLGFNHDNLSDGTGKAGISFGIVENRYSIVQKNRMNLTETNVGGWQDSYMRTQNMSDIFNGMSEELQSIIKTVAKKTTAGNESASIVETDDKIWLYSAVEIFGTDDSIIKSNVAYTIEGSQYAYWKENTYLVNATNPYVKIYEDSFDMSYTVGLRSSDLNNNTGFRAITQNKLFTFSANWPLHNLMFGFCI